MKYNPDNQYRCTIIRGKSQKCMDDYLPMYARIIAAICPCDSERYAKEFNERLAKSLFHANYDSLAEGNKLTVNNHRTEIATQLMGLSYTSQGVVYASPSCEKLLSDNDQPAFFKNLCANLQFPNCSQSIGTVRERLKQKVSIRPLEYVVALLSLSESKGIQLSIDEIAYFVLNNLCVLQGKADINTVLNAIQACRSNGVTVDFPRTSHEFQHIREQINLLQLANVVVVNRDVVSLRNPSDSYVGWCVAEHSQPPTFDCYEYLSSDGTFDYASCSEAWSEYYGSVRVPADISATSIEQLLPEENANVPQDVAPEPVPGDGADSPQQPNNATQIGEQGEEYVLNIEKARVMAFDPLLVRQVRSVASQRGYGYDIMSVRADEDPENADFAKYIEVKTTYRTTQVDFSDDFSDQIYMTRKEYSAARQFGDDYQVYRVYFTSSGVQIAVIANPYAKFSNRKLQIVPITYQMSFFKDSLDRII